VDQNHLSIQTDHSGFSLINDTFDENKSNRDSGSLVGSDDLGLFDSLIPAAYTSTDAVIEFKVTSMIFAKDWQQTQLNKSEHEGDPSLVYRMSIGK